MRINFDVDITDIDDIDGAIYLLKKIASPMLDKDKQSAHAPVKAEAVSVMPEEVEHVLSLEQEVADMPEDELIPVHATPQGTVELDSEGLPWDVRIHTEKRTKMKTGLWKLLRGVNKALVVEVRAQLRLTMQAKPPIVETSVADIFSNSPIALATAPVSVAAAPVSVAAAPVSVAAAPVSVAAAPLTFPVFLQKITGRYQSTLGGAYKISVDATLKDMGIESVGLVAQRPDLLSEIDNQLETLWLSMQG